MSSAAPTAGRVRAQSLFEARTLLANGEQLLVSMILPAVALIALHVSSVPHFGHHHRRIDIIVPGVLALAVVSTAFTGQAISTGFDRRYGVLRLLGVTPLGSRGLLIGKAIASGLVVLAQTIVLGVIGLILGWRPHLLGLLPALIFGLLGVGVFVALALVVAGRLRAEGVLVVANVLWLVFAGAGGLVVPTSTYPSWWSPVAKLLPTGALGDGLRAMLAGSGSALLPWAVLIAWGLIFGAVASRTFRWSD